ncbi:MAG: RHS repeat-associated core domain-containing protein, partial [Muribaculaceae bacterium]|nr:RHS repeat-associated core domain-containing protein [Muribaculaceae bacterium]
TTTSTYTYSGQPLKTTMKEGTVTLITENTYDTWSGLLTATDVTVNGTKQRVSAVTYDDLGRIASVVRGAEQNSGGKVSYKYNIHGQTTSITGPGFSQNLYYADGPGNKLYNGSVSAMAWSMGDLLTRGYKYSYNDYNWLTDAVYGEWVTLNLNKNKYSEKFTSFTRNGGIRAMIRNGLKADGTYGNVDFLNITYRGNQIYHVAEGAPAVTQNGSMDFPGGAITSLQFTYNDFGALTADPSRGITDITYDNFGNQTKIQFESGLYITNVYSATGEKLETISCTLPQQMPVVPYSSELGLQTAVPSNEKNVSTNYAFTTTEYHGPLIYRHGSLYMVLFPGGYATIKGTSVTFYYYTQDYLGNNRAVINGSTGDIEQTIAYYPFGGVIADLGTNQTSGQPYKFGGKELITANGLYEYDFGARQYYSAVPGFTSVDPFCEDTQWLSPYLFCGNDPVNNTDPTGAILETVWDVGNVLYDVGEAAYNHMTGNHDKAKQNWIDAGLDIGAMLIPGIPAGASKVGKAVKAAVGKADNVADAVSDVKKASKGMKNAERVAEGKEFGKAQAKAFKESEESVASEVTIVPLNGKGNVKGNRTRVDILKQNDNTFHIIEFKLTDTTPLTKGQKNAWEHVKNGNGMFEVRSTIDNLNLNPGDFVKVTDYKIITKYKN